MSNSIMAKSLSLMALVSLATNILNLPTYAQNVLSNPPLELELINEPERAVREGVFTANTVSQAGITNPSLWWVRDQFGRQIVVNWLGYPEERRVDLIVDRQIWSFINYVEKYSLINHFALNAREYGYNLRIFNDQRLFLGTATCEFMAPDSITSNSLTSSSSMPSNCHINLVLLSDRGLPANRRRVPAFF